MFNFSLNCIIFDSFLESILRFVFDIFILVNLWDIFDSFLISFYWYVINVFILVNLWNVLSLILYLVIVSYFFFSWNIFSC